MIECTGIRGLMNTFEFCIEGIANARCLITQMILWSSARGARTGNLLLLFFCWVSGCCCVLCHFIFVSDFVKTWKLNLN